MSLPKRIHLPKLSEVMVRRDTRLVLRYYKPNKDLYPERYAHHMLMLSYPFRQENDLILSMLADDAVLATVNANKIIFELSGELIDMYWVHIQNHANIERRIYDDDDNDDTNVNDNDNNDGTNAVNDDDTNACQQFSGITASTLIVSDDEISKMVCSLNRKRGRFLIMFVIGVARN